MQLKNMKTKNFIIFRRYRLGKKRILTFDNIYFFSDFYKKNDIKNSDLIEFAAMAFCNGGIISNSSFSW